MFVGKDIHSNPSEEIPKGFDYAFDYANDNRQFILLWHTDLFWLPNFTESVSS